VPLSSPNIEVPVIRRLAASDRVHLLRLNAQNRPAVAPLQTAELARLLECDGYHLVAVDESGAVVGYLLSFPRDSDYDDTEFCWLRERIAKPFFYICQVVVASEHRRRQIGRAFYRDLLATARQRGAQILCCDVNTNPPNLESFAFHYRLGFGEIGFGEASDGTEIAFLARKI
jgi:hypothetical protein